MASKHNKKLVANYDSKKLIAIGYARESRNKYCGKNKTKKRNNDIMAGQKKEIKDYCKKRGIKLVSIIYETRSGAQNDLYTRPRLQEAISYLHEGKANTLITSDFDRLTRNREFADDFINDFLRKYNYISVSENIDTSKDKDIKKIRRLARNAVNEVENIRKRNQRSVDERARKNLFNGGNLKYGTKKKDNGELYIDEEEQKVINLMFQLKDDGLSYREIAEALNIQRIRTNYDNIWYKGSVFNVMKRCKKERAK